MYDVRLFNIEKRWGLVEEQTARTDHELRRLLGEKGTESLPWSLREALNDPGMCSQAVNSLDEQVKGKRLGGEDAAVEAMSQRSRAINDIRSVRGLDRRIRATRYVLFSASDFCFCAALAEKAHLRDTSLTTFSMAAPDMPLFLTSQSLKQSRRRYDKSCSISNT